MSYTHDKQYSRDKDAKTMCNNISDNLEISHQVKDIFADVDGFSDEDLERPNFPGKSRSEKVPYVLSAPGDAVVQVPATINQYLRPYQQFGITFLYKQFCNKKGVILGDDMGLGKTVQVIGFMAAVLGKTGTKSDIYNKFSHRIISKKNEGVATASSFKGVFLIVSPHSVMYNWIDELTTWGYFQVGVFHKNKRDETLQKALMNKFDVVVTTYETLRNHWELLNELEWLAVIMDEVHHLKDPKTAVTVAAKSLNVKCRIGLTGTPLQNRFLEFWCVLDWANPGCLGEKEDFACHFGKPIMQAQRFDVNKRELATGRKKAQEFQMMINEWCLRRTKSLISDQLPTKDQKVVFCPLSKLQEDIYKTLLQTPDVQLVLRQSEPCDCGSQLSRGYCCYTENKEGFSMKQLTLQYLRILLKVSNHAALLLPQVKQSEEQRKRAGTICEKVFSAHPYFKEASRLPSIELFSDSDFCGKMKVLNELFMLFQRQRDKVLLFSYSTQLLDILESYVVSCGFVYRRLDGRTRGEQRLRVVREFNTTPGIFLFLISTKAGGVGLNLTSANVVVVFDPSWNPADDLQAEDRAYRIGQRKDVQVFRMISTGTVEENMYLRQVYKQQLANVALEGNNERRYFTAVEGEKDKKGELFGLENLFKFRSDGCCVSEDIFKRSDTIEKGFKMAKYQLQPQKVDIRQKEYFDCNEADSADEDQKYDLDEVTSQIIEGEHQESKQADKNRTHDQVTNEKYANSISEGFMSTTLKETLGEGSVHKPVGETNIKTEENETRKRSNNKELWKIRKNLKKSPSVEVNKILADCGVHHIHSNKRVMETSKAENEMTSRALKEVFELGQFSQQPANCFTTIQQSDSDESDDIGNNDEQNMTKRKEDRDIGNINFKISKLESSTDKSSVSKTGNTSVLFGRTPKTIRFCQFSDIAKSQRYKSDVDFAKDVLSSSTTDRVGLLKEYYEFKGYPVESGVYYSCKPSLEVVKSTTRHNTKSFKNVLFTKFSSSRRRQSSRKSYEKVLNKLRITGGHASEVCDDSNIVACNTLRSSSDRAGETSKDISKSASRDQLHIAASNKNDFKNERCVEGTSSTTMFSTNEKDKRKHDSKSTTSRIQKDHVYLSESLKYEVNENCKEQASCFLDVFLEECSQRENSNKCFSINKPNQSSVFDDLI